MVQQTPAHVWYAHPRLNENAEAKESQLFDDGKAAHDLLRNCRDNIVVIEADNYRTKAAQETRDAARQAGQIPLLAGRLRELEAITSSALRQLAQVDGFNQPFTSERTLVWRENTDCGDVWCRARIDRLPDDGNVIYDFKTTVDAAPAAFQKIAFNLGYDLQAAFYERGLRAVGWHKQPEMQFVAIERDPPYAVGVYKMSEQAREEAAEKVDEAIRRWAWCLKRDYWPGHGVFVVELSPPVWVSREHHDRKMAREITKEQGTEILELGFRMQAPLGVEG